VRSFTRKHIIAMAAGVILAVTPLLALDLWISRLIEQQGIEDVRTSAKRAITLAESRVSEVLIALDNLAMAGVNSCSPAHIALMRQAAFTTTPAKEIALLDAGGAVMCTHDGRPAALRTVLHMEQLPDAREHSIDVVRLGNNEMVRLRRTVGVNALAALVPAELFVPRVSSQGGPFAAHAGATTKQGMVIGEAGSRSVKLDDHALTARAESSKYGLSVTTALPRGAINTSGLDSLSLFSKVAVALILIGVALLLPKRYTNNPVDELQRALAAGEFIPYYQPVVDIRSGQLRGAEVLVRWKKSDGSIVLPGAFIPLAETSGLILPLTRALMRHVCNEAGAAIGCRPGLKISFNFAAQLFREESIVKEVRNVFAGSPIDLSQVVLELTERDPIENLTETRRVIAALQGIGVRIAIDDVGTGHSGLSYMLKLGVDIIKIDKMFVDSLGTDRNSTTIVETLIDLAHNMRMDVVAEGVENFEQVMHLRDLGVRSAQGYVFAPPLPGSAFLQLVDAIDPLPAATVETRVAGAARRYISARNSFAAG